MTLTQVTHEFNVLKRSVVRAAQDYHDTDRVLVDVLQGIRRMHDEIVFFLHWHEPTLDVKVSRKLLERHLGIGAKYNVWVEVVLRG